ncbi:hypothetical protein BSKO_07865 [Bryopsis sp. KO-2023]|nr:hypothetical protein BSKO_07865 [Bryopsis sp. KO-2023]
MDEEQSASTPWCNAKTVGPPLIRYLQERRHHGENFSEWISMLRGLNKSWYQEMTSHIKKVTVGGDSAEQLPKSLLGSLSHVTDLAVNEIGSMTLAFDEEAGSISMKMDRSACDILNSAVNIQTLSLAHETESETDFGALIPMNSVKTLTLKDAQSLAVVRKCPNLENLTLDNCCLMKFKCNPRLRHLSIDIPGSNMRIDHPDLSNTLDNLQGKCFDQSLLNGLANLTELTQLRFSYRSMDWRAHYPAVCETLSSLRNLEALSLVMTNMGLFSLEDEFKHGFLNALPPTLRELELWGLFSWADNRVLMETTSLDSLEKLTLGNGQGELTYADLEWVTKLPNLVELRLWGGEVMGRAFAWLRNLPKLRRIVVNVSDIDSKAFQQLCWVGDNVKQIRVWCCKAGSQNLNDKPEVREAIRILEGRGVKVEFYLMH